MEYLTYANGKNSSPVAMAYTYLSRIPHTYFNARWNDLHKMFAAVENLYIGVSVIPIDELAEM